MSAPSFTSTSCPILDKFRSLSFDDLAAQYRASVSKEQLESDLNRIFEANSDSLERSLGERLYYHNGHQLASSGDWNDMTFLQLQHEARIQGILGPDEPNHHTEWILRVLLKCEAMKAKNDEGTKKSHQVRPRAGTDAAAKAKKDTKVKQPSRPTRKTGVQPRSPIRKSAASPAFSFMNILAEARGTDGTTTAAQKNTPGAFTSPSASKVPSKGAANTSSSAPPATGSKVLAENALQATQSASSTSSSAPLNTSTLGLAQPSEPAQTLSSVQTNNHQEVGQRCPARPTPQTSTTNERLGSNSSSEKSMRSNPSDSNKLSRPAGGRQSIKTQKTSAPSRPQADTYRPNSNAYRPTMNRNRLRNPQAYAAWGKDRLMTEADRRMVRYEREELPYLVDIMMVNGNKYFESQEDMKSLDLTTLLVDADHFQLSISRERNWDHRTLPHEIASQLARKAVASHNARLEAEERMARISADGARQQSRPKTAPRPAGSDLHHPQFNVESHGQKRARPQDGFGDAESSKKVKVAQEEKAAPRPKKTIRLRRQAKHSPPKSAKAPEEVAAPEKEVPLETQDKQVTPPAQEAEMEITEVADKVDSAVAGVSSSQGTDRSSEKSSTKAGKKSKASDDNEKSSENASDDSPVEEEEVVKKKRKAPTPQWLYYDAKEKIKGRAYTKTKDGRFKVKNPAYGRRKSSEEEEKGSAAVKKLFL